MAQAETNVVQAVVVFEVREGPGVALTVHPAFFTMSPGPGCSRSKDKEWPVPPISNRRVTRRTCCMPCALRPDHPGGQTGADRAALDFAIEHGYRMAAGRRGAARPRMA